MLRGYDFTASPTGCSISYADIGTALSPTANESRAWEQFALGNAAIHHDIPKDILSKLLKLHWSWISPLFMWVYRPAFIRKLPLSDFKCTR